jgi:hypothetical protein
MAFHRKRLIKEKTSKSASAPRPTPPGGGAGQSALES